MGIRPPSWGAGRRVSPLGGGGGRWEVAPRRPVAGSWPRRWRWRPASTPRPPACRPIPCPPRPSPAPQPPPFEWIPQTPPRSSIPSALSVVSGDRSPAPRHEPVFISFVSPVFFGCTLLQCVWFGFSSSLPTETSDPCANTLPGGVGPATFLAGAARPPLPRLMTFPPTPPLAGPTARIPDHRRGGGASCGHVCVLVVSFFLPCLGSSDHR